MPQSQHPTDIILCSVAVMAPYVLHVWITIALWSCTYSRLIWGICSTIMDTARLAKSYSYRTMILIHDVIHKFAHKFAISTTDSHIAVNVINDFTFCQNTIMAAFNFIQVLDSIFTHPYSFPSSAFTSSRLITFLTKDRMSPAKTEGTSKAVKCPPSSNSLN